MFDMAISKFSSSDCVFVEPTSKDFDCPVCFQVIWNPFLTACCGNHFCEACVKATKEKSNQCPFCNEKPITGITDKKFQRQINELQVYCLHKRYGCTWIGALSKLTEHLGGDKSDGECKFVLLSCTLSCGKQIFRCELENHLSEDCPLRTCICEYCSYSSTHDDVTTTHYSNCPNYPVVCPNSCSEEKLKRSSLDHHLLDCPDEVVLCSFNEMGCEKRMKRRCLQQHIEANIIQHQLMICDAFKKVKKDNEALKDDIKVLQQKNEELQKNNAVLKSAQSRMDHSTIGFVLKMAEGITTPHQWKEYFTSLTIVSTNDPNPVSPVIIKWPGYSEIKHIVKDGKDKFYFTRPFYTHHKGYKMQLRVYPCTNKNTLGVYCNLMRGENDASLKWPYRGTIRVTLLNQLENSDHFTRVMQLGDSVDHANTVKKPGLDKIRNDECLGYSAFISLSEIERSTARRQYLVNDTLYLKISTSS